MARSSVIFQFGQRFWDAVGDLNPQLLRELRGRLRWLPVAMALGLSLLVQAGVLLSFSAALPGSVALEDLTLTTYPQLEWDRLSGFPEPIRTTLLPEEMPDRDQLENTSLFVKGLQNSAPVLGKSAIPTLETTPKIEVGDRLIAINGSPVLSLWESLAVPHPEDMHWAYLEQVQTQIRGTSQLSLDPSTQNKVGTFVELTLARPSGEQFTAQLPRVGITYRSNPYCLSSADGDTQCLTTPDGKSFVVDWRQWFQDLFKVMTAILTVSLMGIGVFWVSTNLVEEHRRGTFNFLRLSPRSPLTLLAGKYLGVPICLYLAIGLALPLHFFAGVLGGHSLGHLLGFYGVLGMATLSTYLLATALSLNTPNPGLLAMQPWLLASGITLLNFITWQIVHYAGLHTQTNSVPILWFTFFSPFFSLIYFATDEAVRAAESGINVAFGHFRVNFWEYLLFMALHGWAWCKLLTHGIQRRYHNPRATFLRRTWSYPLTIAVMGLVLGLSKLRSESFDSLTSYGLMIAVLVFLYFMVLEMLLTGDRQSLLDWLRFRHEKRSTHAWKSLGQALLRDDKSPITLAIAANLLIAAALFLPWFSYLALPLWTSPVGLVIPLLATLLFMGSILLSVLVNQMLLLLRWKKAALQVGGNLVAFVFPGLTLLTGVALESGSSASTIFGLPSVVAALAFPVALLSLVLPVLAAIHLRQCVVMGRSESHLLFQDRARSQSIG